MAQLTLVTSATNLPQTRGPLSGLEDSPAGLTTRYPQDLAQLSTSGKNNKNHWVTFTIRDVEPAAIGTTPTQTAITTSAGAAVALTTVAGAINIGVAAINNVVNGGSGTGAAVGQTAALGAAAALTAFITSGTGLKVSPPISSTVSIISLYMPDTLTASYDANYEEMSLTSDLGPLITTLRAIGSSGESILGSIKSSFGGSSGGNDISTNPNVSQALTGTAAAMGLDLHGVDLSNLTTVLQQGQGYALNPQLQMVYRGTGLRTFSLSFTMTPKSQEEALVVNNIVQQFRFYSAPSLGQTNGNVTQSTTDAMFLIPPSIFNLQFFVNGQESTVLPKYGDCVLTNVEVNHAPNGFSAFTDGSMVQTQLNLSFKELNILTRDNFADLSNPRR